ncbi:MAG: radical SAM protein [Elusimicrobiota bacterium]|jgi:radical SAM superfamily enzyme YgiQ (UPF0313 family)
MSGKCRVLFLYPNVGGARRIALGISILSSCLKKAGHEVDVFDGTFYKAKDLANELRVEIGVFQEADMSEVYTRVDKGDIRDGFLKKVRSYKPDIIALTLIQDDYFLSRRLLQGIKKVSNAFVVAGAHLPTAAPKLVLQGLDIDAVAVGEGEVAMVSLADAIAKGGDPYKTPNLCYLKDGELVRNAVAPLVSLEELEAHDYSIFDDEHLWRPFCGKKHRVGYVQLTRGCPFNCTFCSNGIFKDIYGDKGRVRSRSLDQFIREAAGLKERYGLHLMSFFDENFLGYPRLEELCEKWKASVDLPFMMQTRVETIEPKKLQILKRMGCITISVGIESGDEGFRRKMLNRRYSNETVVRAFRWLREAGIRTTANNIIGFPHENEEQIKRTVALNRECRPDSVKVAYFAPYIGSALHALCLKEGLIKDELIDCGALVFVCSLDFPAGHKQMLRHYFEHFQELVFSDPVAG